MNERKACCLCLAAGVFIMGAFAWPLVRMFLREYDREYHYAERSVKAAQALSERDVEKVVIMVGKEDLVFLYPKNDTADIKRILDEYKKIRVERWKRSSPRGGDRLRILAKKGKSGVGVDGDLSPEDAPVINPTMRSDNLGRIVHEVVSRKTHH